MSILDRLLGLGADGDLTDTSWWTDTIFRGLEQEGTPDFDPGAQDPDSPD